MAFEDFKADSIVDIKPYTPMNWYPDYGVKMQTIGNDTTGFVFSKMDTALVYRHKPGVVYPVTCKLVPYTNLEWKDYVFKGEITKPAGSMYDNIPVGLTFYQQSNGDVYKVSFESDGVWLSGGGYDDGLKIADAIFTNGQTLGFKITIDNQPKGEVADSSIKITIETSINGGAFAPPIFNEADENPKHLKNVELGIEIDLSSIQNNAGLQDITIKNVSAAKIR